MTDDSPTQRVGAAPASGFETVEHRHQMLSLQNTTTREEVEEFDARIRRFLGRDDIVYAGEPKMDGVAVELVYQGGVLTVGSTRGDGVTGENVTANIRTIKSVPLRLRASDRPAPKLLEVRGEVYLPIKAFRAVNREREEAGLPVFANPPNSTAGSLKQPDSRVTASRPRDRLPRRRHGRRRGVRHPRGDARGLRRVGPPAGAAARSSRRSTTSPASDELATKRDDLPFEIDGAVVKVNDLSLQRRLGRVSLAALGRRVEVQAAPGDDGGAQHLPVGRPHGRAHGGEMEPVAVGGVTVRNASLHNMDEVERKDVRIGDTVLIERAGDVIPYVVKVLTERRTGDERRFEMPSHCPVCGAQVVRPEDEVAYRCTGADCPAQLKQRLSSSPTAARWTSRLGEARRAAVGKGS